MSFSIQDIKTFIPINSVQGFLPFFNILTQTYDHLSFGHSNFDKYEVIFHCGFNFYFSDN